MWLSRKSNSRCLFVAYPVLYPFQTRLGSSTLLINKYADSSLEKRILILNVTEQPIRSYMNFMNSLFCYRSSCPIDVCQLYSKHSPFLKRVTRLSKGLYVKAASGKSLYGLLSYYFLSDAEVRRNMIVPNENIETMNVTCSCHGKPIHNGIAYVCPVCLSILCSKVEKCPMHHMELSVCWKQGKLHF